MLKIVEDGIETRALAAELCARLREVRQSVCAEADTIAKGWDSALQRGDFRARAENLALYLAMRKRDLTEEQAALSMLGLSTLGRSEGHVLGTLDSVIAALCALSGETPATHRRLHQETALARQVEEDRDTIFGADPAGPDTRIMTTLPSEAADDPAIVAALIEAGATCVRINCAHDGPDAWRTMAAHAHKAAARYGRDLRVAMDLAGPKVRTLAVQMPASYLEREKKSRLKKMRHEGQDPMRAGPKLYTGDRFALVRALSKSAETPQATLSHPELLAHMSVGAKLWFDDGKMSAKVVDCGPEGALLEVETARDKGARLAPEKGVNLPGVALDIPALTGADLRALDTVVEIADVVGFSFVQTPADVRALQQALAARLPAGKPAPAIILKIETDLAVSNLPRLIVQAGGAGPVAVMIARGDLAVEIGLIRLAEIQEEILWICEAAGVPVVWATQVLENLAKEGHPTRAEATDAAMAQRAECVMLNKGPHAPEAVAFLAKILRRMDRHYSKKSPRLGPLRAWHGPQDL
ncbi:pyruvate kinase [Salipiger sp. P9]|uniref:pyruvate kinase n=1 Tax=Salipiger pentaromativorans TaxID=2943193 RepID=UPI0021572415|nr:pyruvate kinase [Salipiger pentaromativorans]MCR8547422.1 pyruvate kinase [Salipiger pentaromativorans]